MPSGGLKVRANDTDFRFRPGSDFYWLTACDDVDAVLVVHPAGHSPESTLYVEERRDASSHHFFSDGRYGEVWVGARRGLDEAARRWGIADRAARPAREGPRRASAPANLVTLRGYDDRVDAAVASNDADEELAVDAQRAAAREGRATRSTASRRPST